MANCLTTQVHQNLPRLSPFSARKGEFHPMIGGGHRGHLLRLLHIEGQLEFRIPILGNLVRILSGTLW